MYIMQVQGKILRFFIVFSVLLFSSLAFATTFDDIKALYQKEDYREALKLIANELKKGNKDPELYKWQAMNYEALFDVESSIEAYKMYESLKNNKSPEPTQAPTIKPTPIVIPSFLIIKFPTSKPSLIPSTKPTLNPTPKPTPKVVKTPKPIPTPTPEASLQPVYKGWRYFEVMSYKIKKEIKIIKNNSVDLVETIEKAPAGYIFIVVNTKIKYGINIVIKNNSQQIAIIDANDIKHPMFAMSTYKFQYEGNNQSQKSEALQIADYYQISKKDSRSTATFVFKVKDNLKFKSIKIMGYDKVVPLKNLIR